MNGEHYDDPTADIAIARVDRELRLKRKMEKQNEDGNVKQKRRADQEGTFRQAFTKNKRKILMSQDTCGICGRPVDKSLRYPDPMCATVDHIIPIAKGGHPSDITNLQLAHFCCNRLKSDKYMEPQRNSDVKKTAIYQSCDWQNF